MSKRKELQPNMVGLRRVSHCRLIREEIRQTESIKTPAQRRSGLSSSAGTQVRDMLHDRPKREHQISGLRL
ncbi:hypothetical protein D9C73_022240 [Collichthys lucidus]|uniref:Uncharacterized protein n=1 Tax=Collichthys lucidus TaxID=240159 RepID=A0A4U5VIV9_COLLU|nr:hypothetical protein D9C73_022240 [Collichthys lucidus]